MNITDSMQNSHSPHLYFHLGELISSTGDDDFAAMMFRLIEPLVPLDGLQLSEWTLDQPQTDAVQIRQLGSQGQAPITAQPEHQQTLLQHMRVMTEALLIQPRAPLRRRLGPNAAHHCSLVSHAGNRRWVITLLRQPGQRLFSLAELSFLKSLSDTLLPLVERHAQASRLCLLRRPESNAGEQPVRPLRQAFSERLALGEITLSAREQEVCLGLLTGGTVPQVAERLKVKNSSVETYLKRAAAKLGVSGRHGLARWMAGT
ncbi:helix-turn-helix transcriptional regulator [Pseudomonas sp. LJDD11]|uniref:helix-turn-helix transcriptional regulator n=1 Tax=Pseudomonas sp. LJDD11 TaxID=2931984 RepID=UPI00211CF153|nr:helix-turn-helix transcriptional regulator [Pseudomonas sp. LJDD11]MCQ9426844.1 helix-turn-helix transcriptional regulator [Pseudomonas sp. LJDD11]